MSASMTNRIVTAAAQKVCAELLEGRMLLAADPLIASFDGTGHNLAHPTWGSAGIDYLRTAPSAYADGVSTPGGTSRPSARVISNAVDVQSSSDDGNDRQMSAFVYAWGQFVDHDLDLTNTATPAESFDVAVPTGDASFDPNNTGTQTIPLTRSKYDLATGTSASNPRQQVNSITAWMDGSMVYGSDATTAASLRTNSGGQLKTSSGNLLPTDAAGTTFLAGDVRVGENPDLTAIQTLFVREHNGIAAQLARQNPTWTDQQLYDQARRRVTAEIQAITYNEFLPALLGPAAPGAYRGYNANVNPGIANEFAGAAFRIGHSLVGDDVEFLNNDGEEVQTAVSLADAFFNASILQRTGIDPVLKYLASDQAQEVDTKIVDSLRNFLFGAPGAGGMDLASLNIQRGRDHGLADYNTTRAAYGLPKVTSFDQITSDPGMASKLQQLYGSVDNVDLWIGGLAEDHIAGASVGPTFARIISDQFRRLRDGDRLWYQNTFSGRELLDLQSTHLSDVIRRNTVTTNLQENVFFFRTSIAGQVYADANTNARRDTAERGIAGRRIDLVDEDGNVVDTTTTHPDGSYVFDDVSLGTYTVHDVVPPGQRITSRPPQAVHLTRGQSVNGIVFGETRITGNPAPMPSPTPAPTPTATPSPTPAPAPTRPTQNPAPRSRPTPMQAPTGSSTATQPPAPGNIPAATPTTNSPTRQTKRPAPSSGPTSNTAPTPTATPTPTPTPGQQQTPSTPLMPSPAPTGTDGDASDSDAPPTADHHPLPPPPPPATGTGDEDSNVDANQRRRPLPPPPPRSITPTGDRDESDSGTDGTAE